jgi:hypothetical protein
MVDRELNRWAIVRLTRISTLLLLLVPGVARAQFTERPQLPETAQQATRPFKDVTASTVVRLPDVSVLLASSGGDETVEANVGIVKVLSTRATPTRTRRRSLA